MSSDAATGIARPDAVCLGDYKCDDNGEATELQQMGFDGLVATPLDRIIPKIKSIGRHAADKHPIAGKLERFWRRYVSVIVPHASCRDHLGTSCEGDGGDRVVPILNPRGNEALERNFLSYLRTALSFGNAGIIVAQLFRLQPARSSSQLSFYSAGPPLAGLFIAGSLLLTVLGSWRFWTQQKAMTRGKIQAGGWEVWATGLVCFSVCAGAEPIMVRRTWTVNRF